MDKWETDIHDEKVWYYYYNDVGVSINYNDRDEATIQAYGYPDGSFQNSFTSEELRTMIEMLQEVAKELE